MSAMLLGVMPKSEGPASDIAATIRVDHARNNRIPGDCDHISYVHSPVTVIMEFIHVRRTSHSNHASPIGLAGKTNSRSRRHPRASANRTPREEDAYFYLRRRGYVIIARNFRSPNHRGELDLVGWERDVLCFIEVKTRTTHGMASAESAVDRDKQKDLSLVARDFLRQMPDKCESRFDVLAVYYDHASDSPKKRSPSFELFQNAFPMSYNRKTPGPRFVRHN
jgi:Predicted endonuclease distantly related to archaeal Holliday junction resolvase